jgi:hypothetical protein
MEAVLVHRRLDRRHLGGLVPPWLGIVTVEMMATAAAVRRPALQDLPDPLGRDQGPGVMTMAGLPAPLPARGGGRRPALDRGRVGRRGPGGIRGVLAEPLLQLGDPLLQALEPSSEGGLGLGRHGLPQRLRDRGRLAHAAWYRRYSGLMQHPTIERLRWHHHANSAHPRNDARLRCTVEVAGRCAFSASQGQAQRASVGSTNGTSLGASGFRQRIWTCHRRICRRQFNKLFTLLLIN